MKKLKNEHDKYPKPTTLVREAPFSVGLAWVLRTIFDTIWPVYEHYKGDVPLEAAKRLASELDCTVPLVIAAIERLNRDEELPSNYANEFYEGDRILL